MERRVAFLGRQRAACTVGSLACAAGLAGVAAPTAAPAAAVYDAYAYVTLSLGVSGGNGLADLGLAQSEVVFEGGAQPGEWLGQWQEIRFPPVERVRVYADRHRVGKDWSPPVPLSTLADPPGGLHGAAFSSTEDFVDLSNVDWYADLAGAQAGGFTNSNGFTTEEGKPSVTIATVTWGEATQPGSFVSSSGRWASTLSFVNLSPAADLTLTWLLTYDLSATARADHPAREFAFSGAYVSAGHAGQTEGRLDAGVFAMAPDAVPQWWKDLLMPPEFHDSTTEDGQSEPERKRGVFTFTAKLAPGASYSAEFLIDVSGSAYVAIPVPPALPLLASALPGLGLLHRRTVARA